MRRFSFCIAAFLCISLSVHAQTTPNNFHTFTRLASADSIPLGIMVSLPETEPKAIVQFVHGMCEHKERYIPVMEFLSGHGYACIIHDHRGHGASVRDTEDLGYFYDGGYEAMVQDVRIVSEEARALFPGKPLFLFGHSMGSMVVRAYTKRFDNEIDGLIVCGSPSYNTASGLGEKLAAGYGRRHGDRSRPEKIQKLAFGSFNKAFKGEPSANAWICSDPEIVAAYDASPLCNYQFTANGFENLFALMQDAYDKDGWQMANPGLPIWFISGQDDPCRINNRKFEAAVQRMSDVGYQNVTAKTYPAMRHEILNEINKSIVWDDLLSILDAWTTKAGTPQ